MSSSTISNDEKQPNPQTNKIFGSHNTYSSQQQKALYKQRKQ